MNEIITERSGSILRVMFNRPAKKNAMTSSMYLTLADLLNIRMQQPCADFSRESDENAENVTVTQMAWQIENTSKFEGKDSDRGFVNAFTAPLRLLRID